MVSIRGANTPPALSDPEINAPVANCSVPAAGRPPTAVTVDSTEPGVIPSNNRPVVPPTAVPPPFVMQILPGAETHVWDANARAALEELAHIAMGTRRNRAQSTARRFAIPGWNLM